MADNLLNTLKSKKASVPKGVSNSKAILKKIDDLVAAIAAKDGEKYMSALTSLSEMAKAEKKKSKDKNVQSFMAELESLVVADYKKRTKVKDQTGNP